MTNKTAVVTGASRGIGFATALELAKQGYHVIAIARTIGGLEELDDAIKKAGGSATLVPLDLMETAKLQQLGPQLIGRFSKIDLVVSAAGYLEKLAPVAEGPAEFWNKSIGINLLSNVTLIQTLHPLLKQAENPQAVFLSADPKYIGRAFWSAYGATKAALNALVASYAAEHPDMKLSVFVPKPTYTRMLQEAFPGAKADKFQTPEQTAQDIVAYIQDQSEAAAA